MTSIQRFVCDGLLHAEITRGVFSRCGAEGRAYEGVANQALWEACGGAALVPSPDATVTYPFFKREHSITLPCADGKVLRRRIDYLLRLQNSKTGRADPTVTAVELKALRRGEGPGAAAKAIRADVAKMQFLLARGLVSSAIIACFGVGLTQEEFEDRVTSGAGSLSVNFPRLHKAIRVAFIEVDTVREV